MPLRPDVGRLHDAARLNDLSRHAPLLLLSAAVEHSTISEHEARTLCYTLVVDDVERAGPEAVHPRADPLVREERLLNEDRLVLRLSSSGRGDCHRLC
jgi:hypothetical protein